MKSSFVYILLLVLTTPLLAQNTDSLTVKKNDRVVIVTDSLIQDPYDPLAPSRAAFYSAVVPGLGQAYNKKYWKIPLIYAGMAAGVYFYIQSDNDYDRFRNAFKRRLAGFTDDEFFGDGAEPVISNDRLIDAQRSAQRNKDVSIVVTIAFYLVNIIDANVDAHLRQYNVSDDLSIQPNIQMDPIQTQPNYGLSLTFRLK